MKGQRLFVRSARAADVDELTGFYDKERAEDPSLPSTSIEQVDGAGEGLIGKLVGELVAHLRFSRSDDAVRLEHIYVARLLRRKRVGRFMISELARMAGRGGATRIEASAECTAAGFLHAIGFEQAAPHGMLTLTIKREEDV